MEASYREIETISDIVLSFFNGVYLKMNVRLGHPFGEDKQRNPFVKGYIVSSRRYHSNPDLISIKRNFDYYLTLEQYNNPDFYVQFRPNKMMIVKHYLNQASKWLMDAQYWKQENNRLVLSKRVEPIYIRDLQPGSITVSLAPIPIEYADGLFSKGIRLTIGYADNFVDISTDQFMGFIYSIGSIDMYGAACSMINSIPIYQQPQFVEELVYYRKDNDLGSTQEEVSDTKEIKSISGRKPKYKESKSFFDD